MKRKLIIIIIGLTIGFSSCKKVLELEPYDRVKSDDAIKTKRDLYYAVFGCYEALQLTGYYGRDYIVSSDLAADNLSHTATTYDYGFIDRNVITATNTINTSIWADIYVGINRVNTLLPRIDEITEIPDSLRIDLKAQLRFLRALFLFDLLRYYGGVPIRTQPTLDYKADYSMDRSTINELYQYISDEMLFARSNMIKQNQRDQDFFNNDNVKYVATIDAVNAILARVYLESGNYNQAFKFADTVIKTNTFQLIGYEKLFDTEGNANAESIFEVPFENTDINRFAQYFYPTDLGGRMEFTPTDDLISDFPTGDIRKNVSIEKDKKYCIKYTGVATGDDNIYIIRYAEMFLIRAEALIRLNAAITDIQNDINVIRTRAGLPNTTISNYDDLLNEVLLQRRLEFAFEGHRWFDLVRNGKAVDVLQDVTNINQTLFPIPQQEMITNTKMVQNPGY